MLSIGALVGAIVFSAAGQIILKLAADQYARQSGTTIERLTWLLANVPQVWLSALFYALGFVCYGYVLTQRDLSWAYPIVAVGYPLVVVLSWVVLDEPVSAPRLIGSLIIFVGVAVVARG